MSDEWWVESEEWVVIIMGMGPFSFKFSWRKGGITIENSAEQILERIIFLEQQMEDLKKRWPAHSVKPQMILEMEKLEEEIDFLREKYKEVDFA